MLVLMLTSAASGSFVEPASGVETVRVATPGKLVDFSALYVGARLGLYQKEGLNLEFIVMRTGIHYAALQAGEVDYTTLVTSTIRAAIAGMPVRVVLALNNRQPFFLLSHSVLEPNADTSGIQQSDVDGRSRRRRTTHQRTEHDGKKDQRTAGSASAHAQGYRAPHGLCARKQR